MRAVGVVVVLFLLALSPAMAAEETSCTACHADESLFDDAARIVTDFAQDVHAQVGLSCHDCHGGNPSPDLAEDPDAMDESYAPNPYTGVLTKAQIPVLCGSCHSDSEYMRRYNPSPRVDQEAEYWTSHHGIAVAAGSANAAVCTDCHSLHSMRRVSDPLSAVYPTRVAQTCDACHGDAKRMRDSSGNAVGVPTDVYGRWRSSVHAKAMFEREDLSAPTCNDCHGNHGAAPPGLDSVTYVCGQCHPREAELFRASAKREAFELHNEFVADAGDDSCAACHDVPLAELSMSGFTECSTCHGNHAVMRPTLALFSGLPDTPCAFCHELATGDAVSSPRSARQYVQEVSRLSEDAAARGISKDELFDWMVDQSLTLPSHAQGTGTAESPAPLRPEFERLFSKFRIGKTYNEYVTPEGASLRVGVSRCGTCHDVGTDPEAGGVLFVEKMRELTALAGEAERTLLAARRGGVETREAAALVDATIDAQISLQVLVHTFDTSPEGEFMSAQVEGMKHAQEALAAGQAAMAELTLRRKGLAFALIVILAVLIALAWKIKSLPEP